MNRPWFAWMVLAAALLAVSGCSNSEPEMSKSAQDSLKNNMSRELSPEEISKMGGGGASKEGSKEQPPTEGVKPPDKGQGTGQ